MPEQKIDRDKLRAALSRMVPKGGSNPHDRKGRGILSLAPAFSVLYEILLRSLKQKGIGWLDVSKQS